RDRLADLDRAVLADRRQREARVRPADVQGDELCHRPAIASIAEPPFSASSAPARNSANSSRPVPISGSGEGAGSRAARSAVVESSFRSAHNRIVSPSWTWARGPPPRASGLRWIAHGTLPLAPD